MEVKEEGHPLNGLWLWDCSYSLDGDAFDNKLRGDILAKTGLSQGSIGDWWVFDDHGGNPVFSWPELVRLALNILNCEATRLFVHGLHLKSIPAYSEVVVKDLPSKGVSGAKRVNADAGDYTDFSHMMGIEGMMRRNAGMKDEDLIKQVKMDGDLFRLSGKDEGCCVEGSWLHWCTFACNVLASENTELVAPTLYAPGLKNSNY
jgi:hypothetical protein